MPKSGSFRARLRDATLLPLAAVFALTAGGDSAALAKNSGYSVVYTFTGGNDGRQPMGDLIKDSAGNLYGATEIGGAYGNGDVFELTPNGAETVLYSFTGGNDGANPGAGLIRDTAGNLYGTTVYGGDYGSGAVFKLAPDGTETELYGFTGGSDGSSPIGSLLKGKKGDLYGTTLQGGAYGYGAVFMVTPRGIETVLYSFTGKIDGAGPRANLIADKAGNLYGTTEAGGADGYGTVFELAPDGTETVLYSFRGGADGAGPYAGLITDGAGNLYSTTYQGGADGYGTVFKLAPDATETVLYSFTGGSDGAYPRAGVILDTAGNLYGTTQRGGANFGVVFEVSPAGVEAVLHTFESQNDGAQPLGGLVKDIVDGKTELYGTTSGGGIDSAGTVFTLNK